MDSSARVRLDSVQMLRAIAAVAVVTHHISLFANGQWGVDLFFVISGFIMCYVTADSGRRFFAKRIIRVVPLYWAGTLAVFCVALVWPQMLHNTTASIPDLVKSMLFIPFKKGDRINPVLFLGWTLNYEMLFYLLFAASMSVSHRYRALVCSALLLAVAVLGQLVHFDSVPLRFWSRPIILEFAFGMACYTLLMRTAVGGSRSRTPAARAAWTVAGGLFLACLPVATHLAASQDPPVRWGILAALGFYCIVYGLWGVKLPRAPVLLGDASYSLYLFHPYLIQIFTKILGAFEGRGLYAYCMTLVVILLCCGIAVVSYQYLEKPASEFLRRRFVDRPPRALPPLPARSNAI
jgi:peptidoglycan/LPS O-acetylase OafA/YrhL